VGDCICVRDAIIIKGSCPEHFLLSTYITFFFEESYIKSSQKTKHTMEGTEENIKGKLDAIPNSFSMYMTNFLYHFMQHP